MTVLREALLRMTAVGLICSALMALAGRTPAREILRFGCACLTVILLVGIAGRVDLRSFSLEGEGEDISSTIDLAQSRARTMQLERAQQALEEYITAEAAKKGIACRARVICEEENGQVRVRSAEIVYSSGSSLAGLPALQGELAAALGLEMQNITVREENE